MTRSRLPLGCVVLAGAVASLLVPDLRAYLRLAAISRDLRETLPPTTATDPAVDESAA